MSELVSTERRDRVLVVLMRREAKRNAVDRAIADALDAAFSLLDDDQGRWAGVLTGTAEVFSAGSDLRAAGDYVTLRGGGEYGLIRRSRRKPLIAAARLTGTADLAEGIRAFLEKRPPRWTGC